MYYSCSFIICFVAFHTPVFLWQKREEIYNPQGENAYMTGSSKVGIFWRGITLWFNNWYLNIVFFLRPYFLRCLLSFGVSGILVHTNMPARSFILLKLKQLTATTYNMNVFESASVKYRLIQLICNWDVIEIYINCMYFVIGIAKEWYTACKQTLSDDRFLSKRL